jgi:predicted dinucleotide-binding enzyme
MENHMKIGILGSGNMGGGLGKLWAKAGHQVIFSYSRDERKLQQLALSAGGNAKAGTPLEAVLQSDVILLSVWIIEDCDYQAVDAGKLQVARSLETLASAWVQFAAASHFFPNLALKALRR